MSAFDDHPQTSPKQKSSPFDDSHTEDDAAATGGQVGMCPVPTLSISTGSANDNTYPHAGGGRVGTCNIASSPDMICCMSPFGESQGSPTGSTMRMSKMNRLRMQMGLSIGDASTYQTHHRDEHHATPVAAAACEGMTQINEFMYLGSWRDSAESAAPALRAAGITHILNLAREHSAEGVPDTQRDLQLLTIPMNDDHQEDLYERLLEAHRYINECKANGGKVLVHCRRGISRSPAIVVSYLMKFGNMSYDDAVTFVSDRRRVSLNLAFREFLGSWDPVLGKPPTSARRASVAPSPAALSQVNT